MDSKPWFQSKGVWGGVIALLAGVAGLFGFHLDAALQGDVIDWLAAAGGVAGAALAIYGRIKATSRVT